MRTIGTWVSVGLFLVSMIVGVSDVEGRGSRSGGRSIGPGMGSNPRSYSVRPHVRRDGTYVAPHRRSMPNRTWHDNWSTKPHANPYTGKPGTRINPPQK
ncbi:MAG: hypothetical protein HY712_06380 [candidate division NC10 bacterium]|nr:hypothetical protein [candidate division NC10 bacterium]